MNTKNRSFWTLLNTSIGGAPWSVWAFVSSISVIGAAILTAAVNELTNGSFSIYIPLLAILTIASGRFRIKVPGHSATVSVSEVFVFAAVLLFGPAVATVIVAADGLWISLTQSDKRLYRAMFNIAEPAITTAIAGQAFVVTMAAQPFGLPNSGPSALMLPTIVMAAVYFGLNSALTAIAVALESGGSAYKLWRGHSAYLAMNYYAAASLATLIIRGESTINLGVLGLVAPLLILSYAAYKSAASRVQDADRHLREVEHLYHSTVETLAIAVDAKDQVTHGHIRRVQRHTVAVAKALGVTDRMQIMALEAASLLHDVGKLAVPDYVLNKPGALSPSEFERIKLHAAKGAEILSAVEFPYAVVPVVRHHHEQWNGKGYPDGLAGEDIPFGARILSVVDCFDAVTSDRPYRRKMSDEQGIEILRARSGTMYDPRIVEAFIKLIPELRREDRIVDSRYTESLPAPAQSAAEPAQLTQPSTGMDEEGPLRQQLAQLLSSRLKPIQGAEACLFTAVNNGAEFAVSVATDGVRQAVTSVRLPVGEGLAGWVAVNRHTIVNSHADLDLGTIATELKLKACTATPVFAFGELAGVLSVYRPEANSFSDADVRVLATLAQEIGLVITRRETAVEEKRFAS